MMQNSKHRNARLMQMLSKTVHCNEIKAFALHRIIFLMFLLTESVFVDLILKQKRVRESRCLQ